MAIPIFMLPRRMRTTQAYHHSMRPRLRLNLATRNIAFEAKLGPGKRPKYADVVEKLPDETSLPFCEYFLSLFLTSGRRRLALSSRYPAGECLQVLGDGGEVELVACASEATQPQAIEAVMGFQMSKAHFDLAPLMA
jgi:hypothetical protein